MFARRLMHSLGSLAVALGIAVVLPATADASAARQAPQLTISKGTDTPIPFTPGETVTYTLNVRNAGDEPNTGQVTVDETPGTGLTITDIQGAGWNCGPGPHCSRSDDLPAGASYPPITVTAVVASDAQTEVCNTAVVTSFNAGGVGEASLCFPVSPTPPTPAHLSISKSHPGAFPQGGTGSYTLTVSNASEAGTTSGQVAVTDTLPTGVTYNGASGTGWTCTQASGTVTCTRTDPLAAGASYPPITLTANVTSGAACTFTNSATVSGGGSQSSSASDSTTVSGGTCSGGNGGGGNGGGGSLVPINLSGVFPMFNNISINNNLKSPGATNTTNQNFGLDAS
ncbi:hypothetical protein [Streptomyces sp. NPDC058066]|uniref:hypothetical protein n=1 Tax=Streptomyces sp. NPDC058066 TaxID=3346323 RepID=UPI0036E10FE9